MWRAIGYDRDPGVLMLIIVVFGITAYELATRYYFIPLLVSYGTNWWLARYERRHVCFSHYRPLGILSLSGQGDGCGVVTIAQDCLPDD